MNEDSSTLMTQR